MVYNLIFSKWKYPVRVSVSLNSDTILKVEFLDKRNLSDLTFMRTDFATDFAYSLYKDLESYFSGEKVDFSKYKVKLPSGFVTNVLNEVRKIPYGKTVTYGEIAKKLGTSPRAVGQALKKNPAPIIIPCHRVVGKNSIGGFSQGVNIKLDLLKLEGLQYSRS